jgi:hypothetical protein
MPKLSEHQVELCVLVIGGASDRFLQALPLTEGVLQLGEAAGWRPSLRLHQFDVDPFKDESEASRLKALLPDADALVLTDAPDAGRHYASSTMERLDRALHLGKPGLPTAVFGSQALADEWSTLSTQKPLYVGEPTAEHAMPVIKALVRAMLRPSMRPPSVG